MTPWLCHGLSYDNQIWYRDSFQEDTGVCKISLSYLNSDIVFRIWGGENLLLLCHRKPKAAATSGGTIVYIIHATSDAEVESPEGSCCSINLNCCIKTCEYFILTIKENCQTDNYGKFGKKLLL